MPASPEENMEELETKASEIIFSFGGEVGKKTIEPVAFGLKSLNIVFVLDENKGSTEELEKKIEALDGVSSVEVTDVRRAVG